MAQTFDMEIETDKSGETIGPLSVIGDDTLDYRFVSTGSTTPSTAVVSYYSQRTVDEPPLLVGTLTIDGTANQLDVSQMAYISFAVTTNQANTRGNLHIYTRKNQE